MSRLDLPFLTQLAYAIGVGILVGLERTVAVVAATPKPDDPLATLADGQSATEAMGVRTFAVLSLVGFGSALAGEQLAALAAVGLVGAGALVFASYLRSPRDLSGITTEAAAMGTVLLGFLCRYRPHEAGVVALVLTVLLASKRFTWETARRMRRVELTDTLKFLVVLLIVLPILPNEALDPWGAFNPRKVGLLVVLISGVSFVGYFLTRIFGARRGLGLTGVLGGLTSSTAVTAAMAADAREQPNLRAICAFSAIIANTTMFVRVLVVVAVIDLPLAEALGPSLGAMAGVALVAAVLLWLRAGTSGAGAEGHVKLKNPFSVTPALKFAAFFVAILFAVRYAQATWGDQGLFLAAGLSGLADVDAITLSVAEQARGALLPRDVGALGITIAVVSNGIVKTGIAFYSGRLRFGLIVGAALLLATGAGLAVALFV